MIYRVTHRTTYRYSAPVTLCHNVAHLTPREVPGQVCRRTSLTVSPEPDVTSARADSFGNPETYFSVHQPHRELTVTAVHEVEVLPREPADLRRSPAWEEVRDRLSSDYGEETLDAYQFVFGTRLARPDGELAEYARGSFGPGRPLAEAAAELMGRIHREFAYDPQATTVSTPAGEVFAKKRGVCQDFAHLQIACLRSLGLAARYVSGYLPTEPPPGQARLIGADATHAWLAVYCPVLGWVGLDPTNDVVPSDRHVVMAWGRDYDDVSPIKGVILGGGQHEMTATVDVVGVGE